MSVSYEGWKRLVEAVDYYKAIGYVFVEAPWTATESTVTWTQPEGKTTKLFETMDGQFLVASGEQSFIQMMGTGQLNGSDKFCCLTPDTVGLLLAIEDPKTLTGKLQGICSIA